MKTYKGPDLFKGINDLKEVKAFLGNSQGDETRTNSVEAFKAAKGWLSVSQEFKNIDYLNQEKVDELSDTLQKENDEYIKLLKETGEYGKFDGNITFSLMEDPLMDKTSKSKKSSLKFDIIDFLK